MFGLWLNGGVRIFLSGYYGYANAGDEAVLAAILEHFSGLLRARSIGAEFVVTAGDPGLTQRWHSSPEYSLRAIGRQSPRDLLAGIRVCDLFVSGGGSLIQDVTSLRNVIYYTALIRMAALSRKPTMIYAQGVGPLRKPLSQKLTRAAMQKASAITVRDQSSADLLRRIGVSKPIEVTADPVWGLSSGDAGAPQADEWTVSLRTWPGEPERGFGAALAQVAREKSARLRLLPMQPEHDEPVCSKYLQQHGDANLDEVLQARDLPPREMVALASRGGLMIAMRLHALIFAASRGVPCVAVNYDPKVKALAQIIGAPCLDSLDDADALRGAIESARALGEEDRRALAEKARSNAARALELVR
jgi:polysaccharide pyruvyl transferase CsaB